MPRFALALAIVLGASTASQAQLFVLTPGSGGSSDLGRINFDPADPSAAKSYTFVRNLGQRYENLTGDGVGGLLTTLDSSSSTLRSLSTDGTISGSTPTTSGSIIAGLARSSAGTLYALDYGPTTLGTLDPVAGTLTPLPNGAQPFTTFSSFGGTLTFGPAGGLYLIEDDGFTDFSGIRSVDPATGSSVRLNTLSDPLFQNMSVFGTDTGLYGIKSTELYSIDTLTGSLTDLGGISGLSFSTFGASYVMTPTPEPGLMLGMAAVGLGLAGWVRRTRAKAAA